MIYTNEELQNLLILHTRYLNGEPDGIKADFSNTDLYGVNLVNQNLKGAEMGGAILIRGLMWGANFECTNLEKANFKHAVLEGSCLQKANLRYSNFTGSNLDNADLRGADLTNARICGSTFYGAVFDDQTIWPGDFDPYQFGAIKAVE